MLLIMKAQRPHRVPLSGRGRIRAESGGTDQGARFTFTIPAAGAATPKAAPPEEAPPSGRPHPPGDGREKTPVLVVDDDPQTLRYVRDVLSDAGYAPLVTARSGPRCRKVGRRYAGASRSRIVDRPSTSAPNVWFISFETHTGRGTIAVRAQYCRSCSVAARRSSRRRS